ncbi:oxidoreductase [Bradyrhizobium japonicum]|jgi:NAD(P)-dependent dehydrogenase (short-subunit alcohol dehydrogenase family)|uniref:NAD(P)-dependent dehydrogenase (Short-subunit alcohol dehydrogenase family) n=1 Tax=Bradyrhizobium japonicum TaxID=375 RepID=A0ABV2RPM0_BRAJP|nr:oxidoreductase [Bradyrhizobium japonicum]MCP1763649.1 NAD(P)-dependent dehydrogenase (short-subunit alcohol dehydrogenase family) [Bradyrhizobium japonicum]MCP1785786.1 NAD(P)-dependent dehydrogenase (short-subunit alcohol dehydrogenase family) [Bradyrhizobium japonicum]MCP1807665.1 NAD(P)-dependent dehydrogenase (short-subunit alcohol dehydrogenase family) [Bradyrhizobium japonicum]MCP1816592.1 NAD(P)-dependent dehydrogenase (short-subunit alcohol dehydrogenase family) [Bradyrhizobium japon
MPLLKTFLITGVSSGLGRAFAAAALAAGHRVIGTVRHPDDARTFGASKGAFPLLLDVTDYAAVAEAVQKAEQEAGPVDVLVNNAGYGHEGVLEESSIGDLERQFAANVFGPVAMIKAVLPGMRQRRRGHIVNVTSMGGFITMPGITFYCGSKFALEGISEALGKEVASFGIRVTALAPGQFRTDWAGRSMDRTPRSIADYDAVMNPIRAARQAKSGNQPGDPNKAAQALLRLVDAEHPPTRLFLGDDALGLVTQKLEQMQAEIATWQALSRSTNFVQ